MKRSQQTEIRSRMMRAFQQQDFAAVVRDGAPLVRVSMKDKQVVYVVGIAASKIGQTTLAQRLLTRVLKNQPSDAQALVAMAELHVQVGRFDDASACYDRVLASSADHWPAVGGKANVLHRRGDNDAARSLLEPLAKAGDAPPYVVAILATIHQTEGMNAEAIDLINRFKDADGIDAGSAKVMYDSLARAYEQTGDYERAFEAYAAANRSVARPFDREAFAQQIETLIAVYSPENLAWLPRCELESELPVIIASLPRAGSTLCEQVIHAHPKAHGAGETTELLECVRDLPSALRSIQPYPECLGDWTQASADQVGKRLLSQFKSQLSSTTRVANKHLDNWLHLGFVQLVMPHARVVHCVRHPMDACMSIFMAAMNTSVYPWTTDLCDIGFVFREHERLMAHWRTVLDIETLLVRYEDLVREPEEWIPKVVEHCGLDMDALCMKFYEAERDVHTLSYAQVRKPLYQSAIGRYKSYEKFLGPLHDSLSHHS